MEPDREKTIKKIAAVIEANADAHEIDYPYGMIEEVAREVYEELWPCEHMWVSTHNPPVIQGGKFCPKCNGIKA